MPKRMCDLDKLEIEQIIRLPFFYRLEKTILDAKLHESIVMWKITFRCNKILQNGMFGLLDESFENEFVIRYKTIEFRNNG